MARRLLGTSIILRLQLKTLTYEAAILLIAEKDFPPPFLTLVNQALPNIFGRFTDMFMTVSARRLLFDGIKINCTAGALYPRAVCIALKQNSRALKKLGNNMYSFSFFGAKNNTLEEFRYTVKRGTEDGQEIGRLVAVDGKPELTFWRGECNKIQGTDASVFPPFRQMENGSLTAYSSELCRVLFGVYEGQLVYKGATGYAYTVSFGDTDSNPGDRCFCPADDRCRKKGVLDTLKCQGAPLVASHPHFYLGSQVYISGVTGLSPDKEKHGILIVLEPISGTPLIVRKRLQFNIELKPIRYVTVTQRLRPTLTPLLWVEENLDLDDNLMGLLEASLFRPIRAVDVIKWMCVVAGIGLGITAAVLKFRQNRRDKVHVLSGEAGPDFDHEVEPNPNLKPEDQDGNKNIDPSFINFENSKPLKNEVNQSLSAVSLMKTVSTMTSANGKSGRVHSIESQTPTLNGITTNSFGPKNPPKSLDLYVSLANHDHSNTDTRQSNEQNETLQNDSKNQISVISIPKMAEDSQESSPKLSPKLPFSSSPSQYDLQNETSMISSFPPISNPRLDSPLLSNKDRPTLSEDFVHKESLQNPLTRLETPLEESSTLSETGSTKPISPNSGEELFNTNEAHVQSGVTESPLPSINTDDIRADKDERYDANVKREDTLTDVSDVTHLATEEDIKAVESDIQKLMSEIAELIPRN
ncbi:hypothetical protein J6590_055338 [Homalodisca vitripennis]|nr:hypothetical protein J6590_055338 [Homalodisca vitripennis]